MVLSLSKYAGKAIDCPLNAISGHTRLLGLALETGKTIEISIRLGRKTRESSDYVW